MPFSDTPNTDATANRIRRIGNSLTDEFGIPISTPAHCEPIALGVKDELLCLFPDSLLNVPFPLLPCDVSMSLAKKVVHPQDASFLNQLLSNTFQFLKPNTPNIQTKKQTKTHESNVLDDLSKAYYRGKIPEILFVHTVLPEVERALIEDLAVYAEKLLSVGFISATPKKSGLLSALHEDTAVHKSMPCIVIVGHGFLYQRFLKNFLERIALLGSCQEERKQLQRLLLGRVCRGQLLSTPIEKKASLLEDVDTIQSVEPPQNSKASTFKIAGGLNQTQRQIQQALGRHGVQVLVEHNASNPAERIELQALHSVLQTVMMPYAYTQWESTQKRRATLKGIAHYRQELSKTLFSVGVHRQAFHGYESPIAMETPCEKSDLTLVSKEAYAFVRDELHDFLPALLRYCQKLQLVDEESVLLDLNLSFSENIK